MRKISNKRELVDCVLSALTCETHFYKPTIIENDPDFRIGEKAQVICSQCVERMKKAIGLDLQESTPSHFQYWNYPETD